MTSDVHFTFTGSSQVSQKKKHIWLNVFSNPGRCRRFNKGAERRGWWETGISMWHTSLRFI